MQNGKFYPTAVILLLAILFSMFACTGSGMRASAQEKAKAQNSAVPNATPAAKSVAPDGGIVPAANIPPAPIIVTRQQILESENLALKVQNAQLQAQAAIPAELRKAVADAEKALNDFYVQKIGVSRSELGNYEISDGVDGSLILKKKVAAAPAPKPEEKK